jgi:hypothetical protein
MSIKSEKTFEEICERLVALVRPQHKMDTRGNEFTFAENTHEHRDGSGHNSSRDGLTGVDPDDEALPPR